MKKMKRMSYIKILLIAMMIAIMVNSVSAMPVSSLPGGTVIPIPGVNYIGVGPQFFGSGITWSSTLMYSGYFGYTGTMNYGTNGLWSPTLGPMAVVVAPTGSMTFSFSTPIRGVGGFINYDPGYGPNPTIAVYDSGMNPIESETLTFLTDGSTNSGEFHGFLETSPEISYFRLSDSYIGITTLTTVTGTSPISTPEFPSLALPAIMILGFLGAVLLIQRTREH